MEVKMIKSAWADGEFKQNTYVIQDGKDCIIIDAGAPLNEVLPQVNGLMVRAVFLTHCHFDHIWHIEDYESEFECPVYIHESGEKFLEDATLNASLMFGDPQTYTVENLQKLKGAEILQFGNIKVSPISTPGHTEDSMCFLVQSVSGNEQNPILFTGDCIFAKAVGRTDLPTGSLSKLVRSIKKVLNTDFGNAYPGHARKTTKQEQLENFGIKATSDESGE